MKKLLSEQHGEIDMDISRSVVALLPQVCWWSIQAAGTSLRLPVGRGTVAETLYCRS